MYIHTYIDVGEFVTERVVQCYQRVVVPRMSERRGSRQICALSQMTRTRCVHLRVVSKETYKETYEGAYCKMV